MDTSVIDRLLEEGDALTLAGMEPTRLSQHRAGAVLTVLEFSGHVDQAEQLRRLVGPNVTRGIDLLAFDTEFTSLDNPQLLSVGFASLAGDAELYLEIDLNGPVGRQRVGVSSAFVHEVVLPQMGWVPNALCSSDSVLAQRLRDWLSRFREPVLLFDAEVDIRLLRGVGAVPDGPYAICNVQREVQLTGGSHHSLADARLLRDALRRRQPG